VPVTVAASATTTAWRLLQAKPPGGAARWNRSNFRGEPVSLALGPAVAVGALAGLVVSGRRDRRAGVLLVIATAGVGLYDDLYGDRHARGLRGHLRALRDGRVTTGMVKLAGLVSAAAAADALRHQRPAVVAVDSVVVAGTANLLNLLDLRPGRAGKVTAIKAAALLAGGDTGPAAAALGAAAAALPPDLGERGMLGDCGANTLGALLGWSACRLVPPAARVALAAAVVVVTLAGERVSFGAVIDAHPALRRLDRAGAAPP
jgi:hypothetical protein